MIKKEKEKIGKKKVKKKKRNVYQVQYTDKVAIFGTKWKKSKYFCLH